MLLNVVEAWFVIHGTPAGDTRFKEKQYLCDMQAVSAALVSV